MIAHAANKRRGQTKVFPLLLFAAQAIVQVYGLKYGAFNLICHARCACRFPSSKKEVRFREPLPDDDMVENRETIFKGISPIATGDQRTPLERAGDASPDPNLCLCVPLEHGKQSLADDGNKHSGGNRFRDAGCGHGAHDQTEHSGQRHVLRVRILLCK